MFSDKNKKRSDGALIVLSQSLIFRLTPDLAPCNQQVAGLHRAVPSATLDKVFNYRNYYTDFSRSVKHIPRKDNSVFPRAAWLFRDKKPPVQLGVDKKYFSI